MDVYSHIADVIEMKDVVLTIGSFDGLHRGHQEVIQKVVTTAHAIGTQSVVITFDPHPKEVLQKNDQFHLLMNIERKVNFLKELGVETTLIIPFDKKFSQTLAVEFLESVIVGKFHPTKIIVGYDHHFGYRKEGNGSFLKQKSDSFGYGVDIVSGVGDEGEIYSSSRIRKLIKDGNVRRASYDLGRAYGFDVIVVHGAGRGRDLNFPTTNFVSRFESQLLPCPGVYFARGIINGICLYGMANLGVRPTFDEKQFVMEIHFFNERLENLIDSMFEIQFLERIRDEEKFDSVDKLITQLTIDKAYCLERLDVYKEED